MTNGTFWLELLARSGVLIGAGLALRRLSRRQGPRFRHRLLVWMFGLLALVPVLSVAVPEISIPLWPFTHVRREHITVDEVSATAAGGATPHRQHNWPLLFWLGGAVASALPAFAGAVSARRLARNATKSADAAMQENLAAFVASKDKAPEILISNRLEMPLVCGLFRSRILLPKAAEQWSSTRLEVVIRHELAHVDQRDVAAQFAARLIAAVWWFQPLVWVALRLLRSESELACDREAIRSGVLPSTYAAELLAIVQTTGKSSCPPAAALGMVPAQAFESRVRAILAPPAFAQSPKVRTGTAFALAAITILATATRFRSSQTMPDQGGPTMKRTILSAMLAAAGMSAATVSGSITDPGGAAVADVKLLLYNPDTGVKQAAVTSDDGRFSLTGGAAGQYILKAEKPGFTSVLREFDLRGDSLMNREFVMTPEGGSGAMVPDKVLNGQPTTKLIRIGSRVADNNLISKAQPTYPARAKAAGTQGTVTIQSTVSKDGVPIELQVISSPSDDLSQSALEAVRQWRYRPTLLNGDPVQIMTTVVVNYTLSE